MNTKNRWMAYARSRNQLSFLIKEKNDDFDIIGIRQTTDIYIYLLTSLDRPTFEPYLSGDNQRDCSISMEIT